MACAERFGARVSAGCDHDGWHPNETSLIVTRNRVEQHARAERTERYITLALSLPFAFWQTIDSLRIFLNISFDSGPSLNFGAFLYSIVLSVAALFFFVDLHLEHSSHKAWSQL